MANAVRHDDIEAIYRKLQERRDTADVTELFKELHRIVNDAIRTAAPGGDRAEGLKVDLSQIDFEKLRSEFAGKVHRQRAALQDIRQRARPVRPALQGKHQQNGPGAGEAGSKSLLASLRELLGPIEDWTGKASTQAQVRVFILDNLYRALPRPPFREAETEKLADRVYDYVWQQSGAAGDALGA